MVLDAEGELHVGCTVHRVPGESHSACALWEPTFVSASLLGLLALRTTTDRRTESIVSIQLKHGTSVIGVRG